jgi:hypothetical protein
MIERIEGNTFEHLDLSTKLLDKTNELVDAVNRIDSSLKGTQAFLDEALKMPKQKFYTKEEVIEYAKEARELWRHQRGCTYISTLRKVMDGRKE